MRPHDQGGVKWRFCSGLLWKAGVFPSQGTAPISPLFSRAQFLVRGIPPPSKVVHYKISISLRPGRAASSGQRRHDEIIPSILLVAALIVLSANRPLLSVADGVDSGLRNALFD